MLQNTSKGLKEKMLFRPLLFRKKRCKIRHAINWLNPLAGHHDKKLP
jgi:hypothetical protein